MELETREKVLEDLRTTLGNDFKAVDRILSIKGEVVKATGDISNVRYGEYDLEKAVDRFNARNLINLLIDETELAEVRDDREEDGSTTYTFKLECASRMLALELMIVWKKVGWKRYETSQHN